MGFWKWFDRGARVDFAGNLVSLVFDWRTPLVAFFGWIVSFIGLPAISEWSPAAIWVASLTCGASVAIIYIAIMVAIGHFRPSETVALQVARNSTSSLMRDLQEGKWSPSYPPLKSILVPDWRLHELFLHIDPKVFESNEKFRIGEDVKDKLSTMQLASWGRQIVGSKRLALAPIPSSFWTDATFTYNIPEGDNPSVWDARSASGTDYADVQVNKAQALGIWPSRK